MTFLLRANTCQVRCLPKFYTYAIQPAIAMMSNMQTGTTAIRRATAEDLGALVPLFDAYRQFYRQPSALAQARQFLMDPFEQFSARTNSRFDSTGS